MATPKMHKETREAAPIVYVIGGLVFGCLLGAVIFAPQIARMVQP